MTISFKLTLVLLNALLGGTLLTQAYVLGIFPDKYFTLAAVGYGITSNIVILAYQISVTYRRIGEGDLTVKPLNKYSWIAMASQTLAGAGLSFLLSGVYRAMTLGDGFMGYKYSEGWEIFLGVAIGLGTMYWLSPDVRKLIQESMLAKLIKKFFGKNE